MGENEKKNYSGLSVEFAEESESEKVEEAQSTIPAYADLLNWNLRRLPTHYFETLVQSFVITK